jgi:M6 family metalloprotease-like protein
MRESSTGAQGFKNLSVFASSAIIVIICLFFSVSGASAQGSAGTSSLAATQIQAMPGQQVQLEGELEITYQDFKDGRHSLAYSLKQSNGTRVGLQFAKEPPTHLLSGDHVRASGQPSGGSVILYSSPTKTTTTSTTSAGDATGSATSSIPVPNTFGAQSTLVILVNFQDEATQPYAAADVQNAFFTAANNFITENSYGQTSITGDVVGWYTIPLSVTACDIYQIAAAAQNAATAAGVNLSAYTRYVYFFPQNNACGFSGASNVGGNPSQSWINATLAPYVVNHELGHAFGLWHAHLFNCGTSATICSSPTIVEYGDPVDSMGIAQTASADYNAYQKERLGWLNYGASPSIQTVTASGTYTINPYEIGGSGANALKVLKSTDPTTGAKTWYYIEQRQTIGFDAFLSDSFSYTQNETTGVLFHLGTDGNGNSSDLLDMTPATSTLTGWLDMSLATGQSFQDSTAGVTFTPTAVGGTGATVQITMNGSSSCVAAKPSVSVSPTQSQYVASGTAVNFIATVNDNDSSSCAPSTFNLGDVLPPGWSGGWNTTTLSLSPGKSGSATLTVTSPVGTSDGSYSVVVSATNNLASSYSGSASAAYVINAAPLSLSLATNQSSYLPGQTVAITVTMLYGTTPDAGASVTATVTAPNGRSTSLSGTTDSNGVALLNDKLSNSATAGTYQVQAQSGATRSGGGRTKGGTSTASATQGASTSFTVQ